MIRRHGRDAKSCKTKSALGSCINKHLNELVQRFEQSGLGDVIQSWIGSGQINPSEQTKFIGPSARIPLTAFLSRRA